MLNLLWIIIIGFVAGAVAIGVECAQIHDAVKTDIGQCGSGDEVLAAAQ